MGLRSLLLGAFALFAVSILVSPGYARIDPGTVFALWLFHEEGEDKELDLSGNGNDGTIFGNPNWTEGKFGEAMEFDGLDDNIDFGDNDNLDVGMDDFSIVVWIKCADYIPEGWEGQRETSQESDGAFQKSTDSRCLHFCTERLSKPGSKLSLFFRNSSKEIKH